MIKPFAIFTVSKSRVLPFCKKATVTQELTLQEILQIAVESWALNTAKEHNIGNYCYSASLVEEEEALKP